MQQVMPSSTVDLWFPVTGRTLPSDHGYALYGALARALPALHAAEDWGLHTLRGAPLAPGIIALSPSPRLGLRLPAARIADVLPLCGRRLEVRGHFLTLAAPTVVSLAGCTALSARLVTIKPFLEPGPFAEAVRRQLVETDATLGDTHVTVGARKILAIDGRKVVGFSVRVANLSLGGSLLLQEQGLGGRRKMGCGLLRRSEHELGVDRRPPERQAAAE